MAQDRGIQELVDRAKTGDREAMDGLIEVLGARVQSLARGYADPNRAEESTADLVQEAWLRAWQKLKQFQGGETDEETLAMLQGWVGQIVQRLGLNAVRDRQALKRRPAGRSIVPLPGPAADSTSGHRDPGPASPDPSPSSLVRSDEKVRDVQRALQKLEDDRDREIIRLRFMEGRSLRDIAARLEMRYAKVRERYRLAMHLLELELGDLE